jgi:formamidopyrimidine-DNA glycosylase
MPELPDLTVYVEALEERLSGSVLEGISLASPFLLRTVSPGVDDLVGHKLEGCSRLAKQLVFAFDEDYFFVIHLMISGRLQWSETRKLPPKRSGLAAFHFDSGSLIFTEASKKKRASLRIIRGQDAVAALDPGGLEVLTASEEDFATRLRSVNHTLKRALTDQRIFAGIGNAYSDEILLRGGLSPFKQSGKVSDEEAARLHHACIEVLGEWVERLRLQAKGKFPTKVTAFHDEMVAHGKYRSPCVFCGSPIQRIVYAENEANYCAKCQTEGRLLADRSLSKLLKSNWPKKLEDLENL